MDPDIVSVTIYGPLDQISMTSLGHPNQVFFDKFWTASPSFNDNRHKDFKEKVKKRDQNDFFQYFHQVHCEAFLLHICQDVSSV